MTVTPYHFKQFKRSLVLAALTVLGFSVQAQDLTEGLILHYAFDTIEGTTIRDISGNENDGEKMGGAVQFTGKTGKGLFCNNYGDYIDAPDNINNGLNSFTFATWVRMFDLKSATRFFDWGSGSDGSNNFVAFIPSYGSDNGYMNLRFRPASGTAINVMSTEKCPKMSWAHVAVTYDWNGTKGNVSIYLNGVKVGSMSNLSYNISSWLGATTDNYFGFSRWAQDQNGFKGVFDELRVYNRALSEEEVLMLTGLDELFEQYDQLDPGDLSDVTGNINLPTSLGENGVTVNWKSSQTTVIKQDGTVIRPNYFDVDVTLTATVSLGSISKVKSFEATVKAKDGTAYNNDLLVRYDFSNLVGSTVKDVAEKEFTGTLKNSAKVVSMGTASTGIFNVLNLGSTNGYFDMGSEMGSVVSRMTNYSISAYFRIDESYAGFNSNGNFLWNLSNTNDAMSRTDGYLICSLKDQSVSISPGNYTSESGNQDVAYNKNALKGNWHHLTYTQQGNMGTIYIDGISVATGKITNLPSNTLFKSGFTGTMYNWIGRSCYNSDVYLRNTLVYDFRMYSKALTDEEILHTELHVESVLAALDNAYSANIADSKTNETTAIETGSNPEAGFLEIYKSDASIVNIALSGINRLIFSDDETNFILKSGGLTSYQNTDIEKMVFTRYATPLDQAIKNVSIAVFPNPASRYIKLKGAEKKGVDVYSVSGKLMKSFLIQKGSDQLDISTLPDGVYLIKNGTNVVKFLKQ